MNYSIFYRQATKELTSTFLFLHGRGDTTFNNHLEDMLRNEPLMREPIFQTIFPWKPYAAQFQTLGNMFGSNYINALSGAHFIDPLVQNPTPEDMSFGLSRYPYDHQYRAWDAVINRNKSLLVTTGTGSGKTECFLVPILKELYESKIQNPNIGIQAIFLYPLNALIASQRKRIHAWCSSLNPQVAYCNYTRDLEQQKSQNARLRSYPQLIDRVSLRNTPPQILLTNPTMLEYMMVRSADQQLAVNSDLRWIVLDEAHTYNGTSAEELALQLRRIIKFFGKTPNQVKFAITSATIGHDPAQQAKMHSFIEKLTGKIWGDFEEIDGDRVVDDIDYNHPNTRNLINSINQKFGINLTSNIIDKIRSDLNTHPSLSLNEIVLTSGLPTGQSTEQKLKLVDALSTIDNLSPAMLRNGLPTALLPTRAHFYVRSVDGVYACTNPACSDPHQYRPISLAHHLTTYKSIQCPSCHGQMLEVVKCPQCGELLLQASRIAAQQSGQNDKYKMCEVDFVVDSVFDFVQHQPLPANTLLIDKSSRIVTPPLPQSVAARQTVGLDAINGEIVQNSADYLFYMKGQETICPKCGEAGDDMIPLNLTPTIIQTHLSRILLQQSESSAQTNAQIAYQGRKYISFTDNRQKTAATARSQNIDVERNWIRGAIYHALVDQLSNPNNSNLQQQINQLAALNNPQFNAIIQNLQQQINDKLTVQEVYAKYLGDDEVVKLQRRFRGVLQGSVADYLQALIIDQMATRSLRTALSLETLGLVHWYYPQIEAIGAAPASFVNFYQYSGQQDVNAIHEWRNLLKYLIDVTVRNGRHISIPAGVSDYLPHDFYANPIYKTQPQQNTTAEIWPSLTSVNRPSLRREIVMLLLAKGIININNITPQDIQSVNDILDAAWNELTNLNILIPTVAGNNNIQGYKMNFLGSSPSMVLSLQTEGVLCPVTKQVLDYTFRGISPTIKGDLCQETLDRYTVHNPLFKIPVPNFTRQTYTNNNGEFDSNAWRSALANWIENTYRPAVSQYYGDINSQRSIIQMDEVCIAKEHSAQLSSNDLRESERQFIDGEINILDCSTTMEMGVDIGSLSIVTMNNVPPQPQNYLQRVGRAGRRGEVKAMALTIYGDNPIGREIEADPSWALRHPIQASTLEMNSENIIRRHINAILFGQYLSSKQTITLRECIGDFAKGTLGINNGGTPSAYSYQDYFNFLINMRMKGNQAVEDLCNLVTDNTCLRGETLKQHINYTLGQIKTIVDTVNKNIDNYNNELNNPAITKRHRIRIEINREKYWKTNLLTYLGQKNYIPNAYMPTNVSILEIEHKNYTYQKVDNPEREASLAIRDYAPGRKVLRDEMVYVSEGIRMERDQGTPILMSIAKCDCGYLTIEPILNNSRCPICNRPLRPLMVGQAGWWSEGVSPISYIAGEPSRSKDSKKQIVSFISPVLLDNHGWTAMNSTQCYALNSFEDSTIAYINKGKGLGFALCTCGRMEAESSIQNGGTQNLPASLRSGHKLPGTKTQCHSNTIKRNVVLYSENRTDLTEVLINDHIPLNNDDRESLLTTLGTVFSRKFAEIMGIDDGEIDFGRSGEHSIFIFDTHNGGSGFSNKLSSQVLFEALLNECRKALSTCNCSKACTHCLVDRRSQYQFDHLDRQLALDWLNWEFQQRQVIPQVLTTTFPNATISQIASSIECNVGLTLRQGGFRSAVYFYDGHPTITTSLFAKVKDDMVYATSAIGITMACVIDENSLNRISLQAICDLQSIASKVTLQSCNWTQMTDIFPIMITDDKLLIGLDENGLINYYVVQNYMQQFQTTNYKPFVPSQYIAGRHANSICLTRSIRSNQYFEAILKYDLGNLDNFMANKKGSLVNVEYTDRYVNNRSSCILLCDIIHQIVHRYGLTINQFRVNSANTFRGYTMAKNLDDDFSDQQTRDSYLIQCAQSILSCNVNIPQGAPYIPHDRLLRIIDINRGFCIEIEPGGGFAQGWKLDIKDANGRMVPADNTHQPDEVFEMYNTFSSYRNVRKDWGIRFTYAWR